jgi:Spy/CpxP family protein refolding chaperone
MNKFVPLMCAVIVSVATAVYAGDGCCKAGDKTEAGKSHDMFSKLNLTADQKTKLTALKAECDKEGCTEASRAKMMKGLEGILTAEQLTQVKAMHAEAGCPMKKSSEK